MADVIFTSECLPTFSMTCVGSGICGGALVGFGNDCCSAIYDVEVDSSDLITVGQCSGYTSTYYPNRCSGWPQSSRALWSNSPIDLQFYTSTSGVFVDDELLVNLNGIQSRFQPNTNLGTLGSGQTGNCETFAGGTASCNTARTIAGDTLIATLPAGQYIELFAGDNHGIQLIMNGNFKVKPVAAP